MDKINSNFMAIKNFPGAVIKHSKKITHNISKRDRKLRLISKTEGGRCRRKAALRRDVPLATALKDWVVFGLGKEQLKHHDK